MDMKSREGFLEKMNKLKKVYSVYLAEWRQELENYLANRDSWTVEDTTSLQMVVHKITGTGATYGYPNITDAARALEFKLAYANVEFKAGMKNPNKNQFILSELQQLIILCANVRVEDGENVPQSDAPQPDEMTQLSKSDFSGKTIMIVDDQLIIRQTLQAALKQVGFTVIAASDGDDALLIMQSKRPDLVVLDRMMPHLDGMTVLKTMRKVEELSEVPVIFLTAIYHPNDVVQAEKLGAVDYIVKPFDMDEFVMRCMRVCKTKK